MFCTFQFSGILWIGKTLNTRGSAGGLGQTGQARRVGGSRGGWGKVGAGQGKQASYRLYKICYSII